MDRVDHTTLRDLLTADGEATRVSLYLPTHRAGKETRQDPIRLGNLVGAARTQLEETRMRKPDIETLLGPALDLVDDHDFWQHQAEGLALFLDRTGARHFRLPVSFTERTTVGDRFTVKPLVAAMTRDRVFHVLALSDNAVRLLTCGPQGCQPVDLPDEVPESLAEALALEEAEPQLQFRQGAHAGTDSRAMFHGHDGGEDETDRRRFLRRVAKGIEPQLAGDAPVVLAGVERIVASYRNVADDNGLAPDAITGNPDRLTPKELHAAAAPIAQPMLLAERDRVLQTIAEGSEKTAVGPARVVHAARAGRVAHAFVATDTEAWGDPETLDVRREPRPGDRDLLETVIEETVLRSGGEVWALDEQTIPHGETAALLRY